MLTEEQITQRLADLKKQRAELNKEIFDLEQSLRSLQKPVSWRSEGSSDYRATFKPFASTVKKP